MTSPWSESRMREIRTSGLMSGEWKRSGSLAATAPLLDSTQPLGKSGVEPAKKRAPSELHSASWGLAANSLSWRGSGLGRLVHALARSWRGHLVAHQVEFAPVK